MDLANDPLVDDELWVQCDLVDEREGRAGREHLERVLLARMRKALEHLFDLKVVQAVALDPCRAVDRAHPGPVSEPVAVARVEPRLAKSH